MATKPYMVIFKESAPASAISAERERITAAGGVITQTFDSPIMRGFAARMPEDVGAQISAASEGGKHEHIEYVEPDSEVRTM